MSEENHSSLPGPKKKQAQALSQNIKWLAESFGIERVGFLTLTCGDQTPEGFKKISARREASRRFNSLLTHIIRRRYQCGVVVTERHKDGGIHFHLVVATGRDIRGDIDFEAVFPRDGSRGDYSTANNALKLEWKFWRERAESYGFGRCQMQPARSNGEALGFYVAKYISKSWEVRCDDDRGGRLVRYFGNWRKQGEDTNPRTGKPFRFAPPHYAAHATLTPWARAWRECARQVAARLAVEGFNITQENVARHAGSRWSWRWTHGFNATEFMETKRVAGDEKLSEAMTDHNSEARERWPIAVRGIEARGPEWWLIDRDMNRAWIAARLGNNRARIEARRERELKADLIESVGLDIVCPTYGERKETGESD